VIATLLAAGALAAAGCATTGDDDDGPKIGKDVPAEPGDAVVEVVGLIFRPETITVPVGTRVRWQWQDLIVHNIISEDFASLQPQGGGSYAIRFTETGTFPYRCTLHTGMDGTIVVTPAQ
jgi:plastocyanin